MKSPASGLNHFHLITLTSLPALPNYLISSTLGWRLESNKNKKLCHLLRGVIKILS